MNPRSFPVQRPLVCLALSFGVGVLIGGYGSGISLFLPLLGLACSCLLILAKHWLRQSLAVGMCFFALFAGMLRTEVVLHPVLPPEGKYRISATVEGLPELREEDGRVKARLRDLTLINTDGYECRVPAAYWTYYPEKQLSPPTDGQRLRVEGAVYHPMGRQNPFGFNFRLYLLQKGISIGVSGARNLRLEGPVQTEPASFWLRARLLLSDRLDEAAGENSGLIRALLLGDRSALADETQQSFRDAGIAHVLSVSGLHVGILIFALYWLLKKTPLSAKTRFVLAMIALALYCRLLDFAAPVLRASIMSAVLLSSELAEERSDPLTGLAIAFMLILLIQPLDLFHAGFQLSFLAVLGIFTLGDWLTFLYNKLWIHRKRNRRMDAAVFALAAAFSASIFTFPIVLNTFHSVSLIGLFFSPLACIAVMWLMYYGLLILPLSLVWMPLARVLAVPLGWMISFFTKVTESAASLPLAAVRSAAMPGAAVLLLFVAVMTLTRYMRFRRYSLRLLTAVLCLILTAGVTIYANKSDNRYVRYTLFSTGNSDAAVIEDGPATYVIDTADRGGDLASYLLSKGRKIDSLFISHLHKDHIGGLQELLNQRIEIDRIILPSGAELAKRSDNSAELLSLAEESGIPIEHWAAGDSFASGRVRMEALWPMYGKIYPGMDANHHSMVLRFQLDGLTLLSGGDLSCEYEMYSAKPSHVLKLAHHASKGSSSADYLKTVSPQLALLTANRNRLPAASSTLHRLEEMGIPVWGTQDGKAIIIEARPEGAYSIRHYSDRGI